MLFETDKKESFQSRKTRIVFNILPVYRGTRAKLKFVSADWKEVHIYLPLNRSTRNIAGSVFGGSIYSSIDPVYMFMLIKILGNKYVIWDKGAQINFIRPARTSLKTKLLLTDAMIEKIKVDVFSANEITIDLPLDYLDENNKVCTRITKTIYIADKDHYSEKRKLKGHSGEYKLKVW